MPRNSTRKPARAKRAQVDVLHARLVIFDAAEMTPKTAKAIAAWLRGKAAEMEGRTRKRYAKRFTARYYTAKGPLGIPL